MWSPRSATQEDGRPYGSQSFAEVGSHPAGGSRSRPMQCLPSAGKTCSAQASAGQTVNSGCWTGQASAAPSQKVPATWLLMASGRPPCDCVTAHPFMLSATTPAPACPTTGPINLLHTRLSPPLRPEDQPLIGKTARVLKLKGAQPQPGHYKPGDHG